MSDIDTRFARMLHARSKPAQGEALQPAIVPASVYHQAGDPSGPYQYGRWSNPTWTALEEALGHLEDAETIIFPAGLAAVASVFYPLLQPGDKVLLHADGYGATRGLAETYLKPLGITFDLTATGMVGDHDLAGYRMIFIETPSNPGLDICDIAAIAAKARGAGALLVADNTTMTPLGQRPLDLGADITLASDTKALNGHSDVLFGHVATRDAALAARMRDWRKMVGIIPSPFDTFLVHRGLETLELRFTRMCDNAEKLAPRLAAHPRLKNVAYPGLPSHPAHNLAARQMTRFGSLIALTFAGRAEAERFMEDCPLLRQATSFGGLHTSAERRSRWGDKVADGFVRLSVGCEPVEPLWQAISATLDTI